MLESWGLCEALSGLGGQEWERSGPRTGSDRVIACFFTEDFFFFLSLFFSSSIYYTRWYEFTLPRRRVSFSPLAAMTVSLP